MKTIRIEKQTGEKIELSGIVEQNGLLGKIQKIGTGKKREEVVWGDGDADVIDVYERYEEVFIPLLSRKLLTDAGLFESANKEKGEQLKTQVSRYAEYAYRFGKNTDGSVVVDLTSEKEREEEDRKKQARENLHIVKAGTSMSSGCSYYRLSCRISTDDWKKVAHLFTYFDSKDEDNKEQDALYGEISGWLCVDYKEVERILSIPEVLSYAVLKEERKKEREEEKKVEEELQRKLADIDAAFKDAEYPKTQVSAGTIEIIREFDPKGEEVQHPENPRNIYGSGQWWVIGKEWVWKINNNGMDGDDWSRNNVRTGGAGAIGVRIPFCEEIARKIRAVSK